MSKQSNQRYRKEKEKEHFKKVGIDVAESAKEVSNGQNKINHEFNSPSGKAEK